MWSQSKQYQRASGDPLNIQNDRCHPVNFNSGPQFMKGPISAQNIRSHYHRDYSLRETSTNSINQTILKKHQSISSSVNKTSILPYNQNNQQLENQRQMSNNRRSNLVASTLNSFEREFQSSNKVNDLPTFDNFNGRQPNNQEPPRNIQDHNKYKFIDHILMKKQAGSSSTSNIFKQNNQNPMSSVINAQNSIREREKQKNEITQKFIAQSLQSAQNQQSQTSSVQPKETEESLLNKFRSKPTVMASNSNQILNKMLATSNLQRKVEQQKQEHMSVQSQDQSHVLIESQEHTLRLEPEEEDDMSDGERLLFKDQIPINKGSNFQFSFEKNGIQSGQFGNSRKKLLLQDQYESNLEQNNPDNFVEIDSDGDADIEILDEHINDTPTKIDQKNMDHFKANTVKNLQYDHPVLDEIQAKQANIFQQRNTPSKSVFNAFQSNFYNKYFKNTNSGNQQVQQEHNLDNFHSQINNSQVISSQLKNFAKNNSFLKQSQNRPVGILPLNQRIGHNQIKQSSLNQQNGLRPAYYKQAQELQQYSEQSINSKTRNSCVKKQASTEGKKNPYAKQDFINFKAQANNIHQFQEKVNLEKAYHTIQKKFKQKIQVEEEKKAQNALKLQEQKDLKKKQRMLQKKTQQDEVLDELFDYNFANKNDNIQKNQSFSGLDGLCDDDKVGGDGLDALREESDNYNDEGIEIGLDAVQQNDFENEQYHQQYIIDQQQRRAQEAQQKEYEAKMRLIRFNNRKNVDELIAPILNLDLVDMYYDSKPEFTILPQQFESTDQYFETWLHLFLYETFNQLINQRNESDKDREISKMYGMKMKNDNQQKNFKCCLQKHFQDQSFIYLKLFEENNMDGRQNGEFSKISYPHLQCLKEFDLLLLSEKELDTKNVKQLTNMQFLKDMQQKQDMVMAMVFSKRKQDKSYIEIKLDIKHDKYVNLNCSEYSNHHMFVYYFDSMSTRIREFRTIKSAEFFPCSKYILDPSCIPKRNKVDSFKDDSKPKLPSSNIPQTMEIFVQTHQDKFNKSQYQALIDVANMKTVDFLLIQGPPGTGKTHTIKGIISMLNHSLKNQRKILVCAPSNAAIDEIVTRLISKGGLFGQSEAISVQKVLRIGSIDYEPSKIVQQVTMETKLKQGHSLIDPSEDRINEEKKKKKQQEDIQLVDKIIKIIQNSNDHLNDNNIQDIASKLLAKQNQITDFMAYPQQKKITKVRAYQIDLRQKLQAGDEYKNASSSLMNKTQRIALEKKIVENTQIICTTLAMSTNEKLDYLNQGDIDYLIVDEACQSVELNNLIPFEHSPQKVILVGDQQQLPATTFSENAEKTNYSRSMFERFLQCGVEKVMLEIQYRMDPLIREFPSNQFYEKRLQDDKSIMTRLEDKDFVQSKVCTIKRAFNAIQFYDLSYSKEDASETSKVNHDESDFVEILIKQFIQLIIKEDEKVKNKYDFTAAFNKLKPVQSEQDLKFQRQQTMKLLKGSIGIISPYKSQVRCLKDKVFRLLRQFCDISCPQDFVEINTVDAFQGREKDIIIFSCVRSSQQGNLGFVSDYRRMNVAITRAKQALFVVGNVNTLNRDSNWRELINYCQNINNQQCRSFIKVQSQDKNKIYYGPNFNDENHTVLDVGKESTESRNELNINKQKPKNDDDLGLEGLKRSPSPFSPNLKESINESNQNMSYTDLFTNKEPEFSPIKQNNVKCNENDIEAQVYSSGQIADKRTTNTDDPVSKNSSEMKVTSLKNQNVESGEVLEEKDKPNLEIKLKDIDDQSSYQSYCSKKKYGNQQRKHYYEKDYKPNKFQKVEGEYRKDKYRSKNNWPPNDADEKPFNDWDNKTPRPFNDWEDKNSSRWQRGNSGHSENTNDKYSYDRSDQRYDKSNDKQEQGVSNYKNQEVLRSPSKEKLMMRQRRFQEDVRNDYKHNYQQEKIVGRNFESYDQRSGYMHNNGDRIEDGNRSRSKSPMSGSNNYRKRDQKHCYHNNNDYKKPYNNNYNKQKFTGLGKREKPY